MKSLKISKFKFLRDFKLICYIALRDIYKNRIPKRTEHENRPIFSTKFGKIAHVLADLGNRNTGGHGNFYFDIYLTDILK